jgi:hypothetical protein
LVAKRKNIRRKQILEILRKTYVQVEYDVKYEWSYWINVKDEKDWDWRNDCNNFITKQWKEAQDFPPFK